MKQTVTLHVEREEEQPFDLDFPLYLVIDLSDETWYLKLESPDHLVDIRESVPAVDAPDRSFAVEVIEEPMVIRRIARLLTEREPDPGAPAAFAAALGRLRERLDAVEAALSPS